MVGFFSRSEVFAEEGIACNDPSINLRTAPIGFRCQTSKGTIYERVTRENFGEAWKGSDGFIWSDCVGAYKQQAAIEVCANLGGGLPSKADFERGELNGFRQVLPNMKYRWYWSSSVLPIGANKAYLFDGLYGNIGVGYSYYDEAVLCIGW